MKFFTPLYRHPQQRHPMFLLLGKSHLHDPAVSGPIVATIGPMTFTQYIFTTDVGIDQFFLVIESAKQPLDPGRMAPAIPRRVGQQSLLRLLRQVHEQLREISGSPCPVSEFTR